MDNKWKQLLTTLALHRQFICVDTEGVEVGIQVPDAFVDRRSMALKISALTLIETVQTSPLVELYETHGLIVRVSYLEGYVTFEIV